MTSFQEMTKTYDTYQNITFIEYLVEKGFSVEKMKEYIDDFSQCKCCDRHQINKPCSPSDFVEGESKKSNRGGNECKCSCRHLSRFICRYIIDKEGQQSLDG